MTTFSAGKIKSDIAKGAFKPNIYLTDLAMAYFQDPADYIAKSLFPMLPVNLSTSSYYIFNKGDLARDNVDKKPQFGSVQPTGYSVSDQSYACTVEQIITGLDQISELDYQRSNAPGVADPRRAKLRYIVEQLNNHLDIKFANNFFKTGVWNTTWTGDGTITTQVVDADKEFIPFDNADCNPIEIFDHLKTQIQRIGRRRPNKLALGVKTYNALKNNAKVLERIKYTGSSANPAIVNEKVLAELFGLKEVKVFSSTYNNAKLNQTENMNFIGDQSGALLCYATDTPAIDEPSAGYIFTWDMLGNGNVMPIAGFEGQPGTHSEFIEGLLATDMKITGQDLGIYLSGCTA